MAWQITIHPLSEDRDSEQSDVMVAAAAQSDDVMQSDDDIMGSGYQGDDTYFDDEDHYEKSALLGDEPAREALLGNQPEIEPITVSFQCEYITGQPAGVSFYIAFHVVIFHHSCFHI